MRAPIRLIVFAVAALVAPCAPGQDARPTNGTKATQAKKSTKAPPSVAFTFEAHNEGAVEGAIYGDENLVSVTIDSSGIRYQGKRMDKPISIPWDQVSGWQPNNFTSRSPGRTDSGDYGVGVYQGARYFSFRTRNGRDYIAAIRALRSLAPAKERPGIG